MEGLLPIAQGGLAHPAEVGNLLNGQQQRAGNFSQDQGFPSKNGRYGNSRLCFLIPEMDDETSEKSFLSS